MMWECSWSIGAGRKKLCLECVVISKIIPRSYQTHYWIRWYKQRMPISVCLPFDRLMCMVVCVHHTSYIIHLTSYIIHHTSYIIHHTSYIIHVLTSRVDLYMCRVSVCVCICVCLHSIALHRQILFGLFDQSIHTQSKVNCAELFNKMQLDIMMVEPLENTNFAAQFAHLAGTHTHAQYTHTQTHTHTHTYIHTYTHTKHTTHIYIYVHTSMHTHTYTYKRT